MQGSRSRLLVAWVDGVQRRAGVVLCATGVLTLAVIAYSVVTLGVNTHHTAILSDELPFWKHYHEFADVFPILDEALLVVIDAETASEARDAARTLAERLAEQPERYRDVYIWLFGIVDTDGDLPRIANGYPPQYQDRSSNPDDGIDASASEHCG